MLRLTENKVAIQAIYDPDISPGGIYIPDIAKERCDQGIVKYIGPKVKELRIGDYVLFGGYDGTTIRLQDEGVLILMRETAVKCVIEGMATEVEGLYLKGKFKSKLAVSLKAILNESHDYQVSDSVIYELITEVATNLSELYFPATSEMAIQLITQSFTEKAITHQNLYTNRDNPIEEEDND